MPIYERELVCFRTNADVDEVVLWVLSHCLVLPRKDPEDDGTDGEEHGRDTRRDDLMASIIRHGVGLFTRLPRWVESVRYVSRIVSRRQKAEDQKISDKSGNGGSELKDRRQVVTDCMVRSQAVPTMEGEKARDMVRSRPAPKAPLLYRTSYHQVAKKQLA